MSELASQIKAVRRFNRFYTRQIGVLQDSVYKSPFSLVEVRVLYELAHRDALTAVRLCRELGLDPGYLSRILRGFEKQGLISRKASSSDARQSLLALTSKGKKTFAPLDDRSSEEVGKMLGALAASARTKLVKAIGTIETLLEPPAESEIPNLLRPHRPGDMGWVVHRHGALYWQEYHYDERFEALVAEIVAKFIQNLDPKRERCWMAERDGEIVGSVFLVKQSKTAAKLRLLLVEPSARGLGLGRRLVEECIRFAREAGYRRILLWTQSELLAARSIYQRAGFRLVGEKRHDSWSREDLVSETWELKL
jgi:DNA-binding MarR family transcriptional regulator/GNAT superfamily N-acetyltransferase